MIEEMIEEVIGEIIEEIKEISTEMQIIGTMVEEETTREIITEVEEGEDNIRTNRG